MSEEIKRTKQLEVGKTVIATITGKVDNAYSVVPVLYGNICENMIDGEIKQIREDTYDRYLDSFFESEEGKEYIIPTARERAEAKVFIKNKLLAYDEKLAKQRQEELEKAKIREEDNKRLDELYEVKRNDSEPETPTSEQAVQSEDAPVIIPQSVDVPTPILSNEDEDDEDEVEEKKHKIGRKKKKDKKKSPKKKKPVVVEEDDNGDDDEDEKPNTDYAGLKKLVIVAIVINLLSTIGLVAMFLFGDSLKANVMSYSNVGELTINGTTYTVPLSTVNVQDGETNIVFYAITTRNDEGVISHDAYPVGEWTVSTEGVVIQETK